jgi:hypothetical protein
MDGRPLQDHVARVSIPGHGLDGPHDVGTDAVGADRRPPDDELDGGGKGEGGAPDEGEGEEGDPGKGLARADPVATPDGTPGPRAVRVSWATPRP